MLSPTHYSHSRKKRKFFSRKKIQHGGQIVPVNSLETHIYVNITVTSPNTITVQNITSPLVQTIATNTPGSVVLSVNPSLSTLKDYTLFGHNGTSWVEVPRANLDMGGNTVALYGNISGMLLRKQSGSQDKMASVEVSIPVPVSTYGNVMQFVNIATSIFPFPLAPSTDTFSANVYIQLVFVDNYPTANTKLSGFLPKYIPGLNLWLNASEPGNNTFTPNTGVKMLNWTDKSGQNNHASGQTATAPIYRSLPGGVGMGLYFNGSTFFSGNLRITGKHSYTFVVARPDQTNNPIGRLLSLGAPTVDDSSSNASMGVSASSGAIPPTQKVIVMGLGHLTTGWTIKYNSSSTSTTANNVLTWQDATSSWTNGACCSIAYGMGIFVAVGYSGQNGVIKWSRNGVDWNNATMAAPGDNVNYGFGFNNADKDTVSGGGGIRTVIFTGSIWICGGVNSSSFVGGTFKAYQPGLAYSYNGMDWIKNTTALPFTGTGNCITSIASDGNLIILTGVLTPSMSYSYDGINWLNMSGSFKAATQVGNTPNTGVHVVAYNPQLKVWMAGGDGGSNTRNNPTLAESYRKFVWSMDGFNWNMTSEDRNRTKVIVRNFVTWNPLRDVGVYLRRICSVIINNSPHFVLSGPYLAARGTEAHHGPYMSSRSTTSPFGIEFYWYTSSGHFPNNGTSPTEVSAAYFDGTYIYYGLQSSWNNTHLLYYTPNGNLDIPLHESWNKQAVPGITAPVNVIVDNTSGDTNVKGNIHLNNKTTNNKQPDTDAAKPYMITAWEDGANTCVAVNGTIIPQNIANPGKFNITSYAVGKNVGNSFHNYTGYIYEILVYNSLLYSSSRFAIEGYLAWKWGIQQFLPSSHAYSKDRPSTYSMTTPWPKVFSDLQPVLWLDAQDPNANDSFAPEERTFIKTWYDKSGNQNDLTAPSYSEPMYTKNIIKAGGIQFNRYAYKSMSYIPVASTAEDFPDIETSTDKGQTVVITNNTPSNWIPGFGSFGGGNYSWDTCYDDYGFLYVCGTNTPGKIFQYDEKNHQIRVLYYNKYHSHFSISVYASPRNGYVYFSSGLWNNPAEYKPLFILVPSSFPPTAATNYATVRNPRIRYFNWNTQTYQNLYGCTYVFVMDKNENMYLCPVSNSGGGFGLYVIPASNFLDPNLNEFTSTIYLRQVGIMTHVPYMVYSPQENSISLVNRNGYVAGEAENWGRQVIYLDTMATFKATISGTTLTVESIMTGKIQLGSSIDITNNGAITAEIVITAQVSGNPGGPGTYTLNMGSQAAYSSLTNMVCIMIVKQMFAGSATANGRGTLDGLLNLGESTDALATTNNLGWHGYSMRSFDPISNNYFCTRDGNIGDNIMRMKRFNVTSRQIVTMAGSINNVNSVSAPLRHEILSEKYPLEYGVRNNSNQQIRDIVADKAEQYPLSIYVPLFIGQTFAYFVTNAGNPASIRQVARIKNFRANPSCMSGPLSLNGPTVSMFIVYSNTNNNMNIMPHNAEWNTPILSLSSTEDFCVFIGGISGTMVGTFGTILKITQIVSGSIQQGATISTPLGGFISSARPGTSMGQVGSYSVSILQYVPPGTRITASNGIGRVYTGGEHSGNGPRLGIDTMKPDFISLYANNTSATVYRNNTSVAQMSPAVERNVPSSGIMTQFMGSITGTTLTVERMSSGVIEIGSIINIPGNPIKPMVTSYNTTNPITGGFDGTYTVEPSFSKAVPAGTTMTTDTKATRFSARISDHANTSIAGTTLFVNQMFAPTGNTLQIGATINIPGNPVKPVITGYGVAADGFSPATGTTGTYTLDTPIFQNYTMMTITNPIIPDILFVKSTSNGTTTRLLTTAYRTVSTTGATTTASMPFKISSIGLGLQPSNISRINSLLPNYFFDGTICEILVYNQDVSTHFYKNQNLEGYLAWKWGAQMKLPVWHLYRNKPPGTFVEKTIPTGTLAISKITESSFTVSWPNDNITGNYSYFLIASPPASPQTFTGANATDDGTTPNLSSAVALSKDRIIDNWATSKSITITGLTANTSYKFRIMSHGSLSFVNTDTPDIRIPVYALATIAGNGTSAQANNNNALLGSLQTPRGITVDSRGNIFVSDSHRIRGLIRTGPTTYSLTIVAGGASGFVDNNDALLGSLSNPMGLAADSSGNIFIADRSNNRIRKLTPTGTTTYSLTTIAGSASGGFLDNNDALLGSLSYPEGITLDSAGNIFVADTSNHRIRKLTPTGATTYSLTTIAGNGSAGYADNSIGTLGQIKTGPNLWGGIVVDSAGNIFVADTDNFRIRRIRLQ